MDLFVGRTLAVEERKFCGTTKEIYKLHLAESDVTDHFDQFFDDQTWILGVPSSSAAVDSVVDANATKPPQWPRYHASAMTRSLNKAVTRIRDASHLPLSLMIVNELMDWINTDFANILEASPCSKNMITQRANLVNAFIHDDTMLEMKGWTVLVDSLRAVSMQLQVVDDSWEIFEKQAIVNTLSSDSEKVKTAEYLEAVDYLNRRLGEFDWSMWPASSSAGSSVDTGIGLDTSTRESELLPDSSASVDTDQSDSSESGGQGIMNLIGRTTSSAVEATRFQYQCTKWHKDQRRQVDGYESLGQQSKHECMACGNFRSLTHRWKCQSCGKKVCDVCMGGHFLSRAGGKVASKNVCTQCQSRP
jgi:hypothetical protein